jgi:uncharacterized protein YhdP
MKDGILCLNPLTFENDGGRVNAELALNLNLKEQTTIESNIKMNDMDVKSVLSLLSLRNDMMTGTLNGKSVLFSQFAELRELKQLLNGNVKLRLSSGRIEKFTILSKILTILNVSQLFKLRFDEFITKGMPYKTIKGTCTIKNGVISTEDLFLDSDQIRISAVGTVNLVDDRLNLNLGVEPLVTVDKILNNLPLIGRIITGKDKSLIVSYFTVTGNIADPEVKVIPLKSLTKGVSGILEQILGIPQQLIEVPQKILNPS